MFRKIGTKNYQKVSPQLFEQVQNPEGNCECAVILK